MHYFCRKNILDSTRTELSIFQSKIIVVLGIEIMLLLVCDINNHLLFNYFIRNRISDHVKK